MDALTAFPGGKRSMAVPGNREDFWRASGESETDTFPQSSDSETEPDTSSYARRPSRRVAARNVHYGHEFYGSVTFVQPSVPPPDTDDPHFDILSTMDESKITDEDVQKQIDCWEKTFGKNFIPPHRREELEQKRKEVRELAEEKNKLDKDIEDNAKLLEYTLLEREKMFESVGDGTLEKKLQDLKTFLVLLTDEDAQETREILHMIEAKDIAGLQESLQEDVKRMFDLDEYSDLPPGSTFKGSPSNLTQRLAGLRRLITRELDESDPQVRVVLDMIDREDVDSLKLVLTKQVRKRFGLLNEEEKKDSGTQNQPQVEKKKKKKALEVMERLAEAIKAGKSEVIQQITRSIGGTGYSGGFADSYAATGSENVPDKSAGKNSGITEVQVMHGRGHVNTIKSRSSEQVTGLTYLPEQKWIVTSHFRSPTIWVYTDEGEAVGSFALDKMQNPSGMCALKGIPNRIAISDFHSKRVHLVTLGQAEDKSLKKEDHCIWKLLFQPSDVSNFEKKMLLVANMRDDAMTIFTEEGKHVGNIKIQDYTLDKLYAAVYNGKEVLVVDCNDDDSAILWVNLEGKVVKCYSGKKQDEQIMEDALHVWQDDKGQVLVADYNNDQVHLLNKEGKFQQFLLQCGDGVDKPRRLYLDTSCERPRLFLGCGRSGDVQIRIYDYRAFSASFEWLAD